MQSFYKYVHKYASWKNDVFFVFFCDILVKLALSTHRNIREFLNFNMKLLCNNIPSTNVYCIPITYTGVVLRGEWGKFPSQQYQLTLIYLTNSFPENKKSHSFRSATDL